MPAIKHTHTLTMAGLVDAVYGMIRTSFNVAVVCVRVMNARIEGRILNRIRQARSWLECCGENINYALVMVAFWSTTSKGEIGSHLIHMNYLDAWRRVRAPAVIIGMRTQYYYYTRTRTGIYCRNLYYYFFFGKKTKRLTAKKYWNWPTQKSIHWPLSHFHGYCFAKIVWNCLCGNNKRKTVRKKTRSERCLLRNSISTTTLRRSKSSPYPFLMTFYRCSCMELERHGRIKI